MLKEALDYLGGTFKKAHEARLLAIPGDGRKAFVDQGGTIVEHAVTPPLRTHIVDSVDDLISAASLWNAKPTIWIAPEAVVLVTDDADRRDRVTLPLVKSHQFSTLLSLQKNGGMDQSQFIRLLKVDLAGAVGRQDLITAVRKIKWRAGASGESNITHGSESLGRTIENEVSGAGAIPEDVVVNCPVYQNPGERDFTFGVLCDLEIVPSECKFRFKPLADEIEKVTVAALDGIRSRIQDGVDGAAVFYGKP